MKIVRSLVILVATASMTFGLVGCGDDAGILGGSSSPWVFEGNMVVSEVAESDGAVTSYEYDEMGRMTARYVGYGSESYGRGYEYDYDSGIRYRVDDGVVEETSYFETDEYGRIVYEADTLSSGELYEVKRTYDSQGQILSCEYVYGESRAKSYVYIYTWDEEGMLIKREKENYAGDIEEETDIEYSDTQNTLRQPIDVDFVGFGDSRVMAYLPAVVTERIDEDEYVYEYSYEFNYDGTINNVMVRKVINSTYTTSNTYTYAYSTL